jgi:two-component system NtrC family sensor kinase
LVGIITLALILSLGASGWFALHLQRRQLLSMLERSATETGETVLTSMHSSMLANDQTHLRGIIENIGRQERVLELRIVNAEGEIRHSSDPTEIGQMMSLSERPCTGCHRIGVTNVSSGTPTGPEIYPTAKDAQTLGLGVPIWNSPSCSTSNCHFHPPEQRVLGVLDLELSTASIKNDIAGARAQIAVLFVITILLISSLVGWLVWRVMHKQIRSLTDGTRKLAQGELRHRIAVDSPTELGELAASFNVMAERLQAAYQELEEWGHTLEKRVDEKTRELARTHDQMIFAAKMASLGKLAAVVAHEINNPLAGVLVHAKLMRRRLPKLLEQGASAKDGEVDGIKETLASMEREVARCGELVRSLLLFSRRRATSMAPEGLNTILERAVSLVRHQADLHGVAVVLELDPQLPSITCDGSQIEQAVLAIIMNAIEAMVDGGSMTIRTSFDAAKDEARIEIGDTGVGIPNGVGSKIFEPFFTTKDEGKGTGLGLSVMYNIVQNHGGQVRFKSPAGCGTTFTIELPAQRKTPDSDSSKNDAALGTEEG